MAPNKKSKKGKSGSSPTTDNEGNRQQTSGKSGSSTSSNREESIAESDEDAFAQKGAVRNPDQAGKAGQGKGNADPHQRSRESGTTALGGETPGSDSIRGPGGVEGSGGRE